MNLSSSKVKCKGKKVFVFLNFGIKLNSKKKAIGKNSYGNPNFEIKWYVIIFILFHTYTFYCY